MKDTGSTELHFYLLGTVQARLREKQGLLQVWDISEYATTNTLINRPNTLVMHHRPSGI